MHETTSTVFIALNAMNYKINRNNFCISLTNDAVKRKNNELKKNKEYISYLEKELKKLHLNRELAYRRIVSYEKNIKDLKVKAISDLAIERAIRMDDLTHLAGLWPSCCIMPSILRTYSSYVAENGLNPEDISRSNRLKASDDDGDRATSLTAERRNSDEIESFNNSLSLSELKDKLNKITETESDMSKKLSDTRDEISKLSHRLLGKSMTLDESKLCFLFEFDLDNSKKSRAKLPELKSMIFSPSSIPSITSDILNYVKKDKTKDDDKAITPKILSNDQRLLPLGKNGDEFIHRISMAAIVAGFFGDKKLAKPQFSDPLDDVQSLLVTTFFSVTKKERYSSANMDDEVPLTQVTVLNHNRDDEVNDSSLPTNFGSLQVLDQPELQTSSFKIPNKNYELNNFLNKVLESTCFDFKFDSSKEITETQLDHKNSISEKLKDKENLHLDKVSKITSDINVLKLVLVKNYVDSLEKHNVSLKALKEESSNITKEICENRELITNTEQKIKVLQTPSIKPTLPEVRM